MMSIIDNIPLIVMGSLKKEKDRIGTKIYPRDSNMGISFSPRPFFMAYMLIAIDTNIMLYATKIRQFNRDIIKLLCFFNAEVLRST